MNFLEKSQKPFLKYINITLEENKLLDMGQFL